MVIEKVLCVVGIIMCMIGTVLSLWTILTTKIKRVGTCEQFDNAQESFKKRKDLCNLRLFANNSGEYFTNYWYTNLIKDC